MYVVVFSGAAFFKKFFHEKVGIPYFISYKAISLLDNALVKIQYDKSPEMIKRTILLSLVSLGIYGNCHADTTENLRLLRNEAHTLFYQNRTDLAWAFNKQALTEAEKEIQSQDLVLAALSQQAYFYSHLKQFKQEQEIYLRMLAIEEKDPKRAGSNLSNTLGGLANAYLQQGNDKAAEETLLRAIDMDLAASGNKDFSLEYKFEQLGEIYLKRESWEQAETALKRAYSYNEKRDPSGRHLQESLVANLAKVYRATNRSELATGIEDNFKKIPKPGSPTISLVSRSGKYRGPLLKADTCQQPRYPDEAVIYELRGVTQLRFLTDENGKILAKYIFKSSGWKILDDAVFNALSQCKIEPATYNDKPEASWLTYRYTWNLDTKRPDLPAAELAEGSCLSDKYSIVAQDAKQWLARLRYRIDNKGKPYGIKIEDSSKDAAIDNELVSLLRGCKFTSEFENGKQYRNIGVIRFVRTADIK